MNLERFRDYLNNQAERGGMSPKTADTYHDSVRMFAEWWGSTRDPSVEDCKDWVRHLARERGVANQTIQKHTMGVAKYLYYENRESEAERLKNWVTDNYPASDPDVPEGFDDDTVAALKVAAREDARDAAIETILRVTGCRVSELVALTTDDVSASHPGEYDGTILVGRNKRRDRVQNPLPLTEEDVAVIQDYIGKRDEYGAQEAVAEGWLFPSTRHSEDSGWHITTDLVRRRVNEIADRADGVDPDEIHPHRFRHTVGAALGRQGRTATEISRFLGQASAASAGRYTHLGSEQFAEMRDEVSE